MREELFDLLAAAVAPFDLELVDLEQHGAVVRVTVDRPGGVDLDTLAEATRIISSLLDRHDPLPGSRYTLEVSSPGVERRLRTPRQFGRALGERVSVRTKPDVPGERRRAGVLAAADDRGIVIRSDEGDVALGYDDIERARTVFEWGPVPAPRRPSPRRPGRRPAPDAPGPHATREASAPAATNERVSTTS